MATLRQRLHIKNKSNSFDVIHLESSSDVILHGNQSLEGALICLPKIKTDNTDPTAPIKTGEVLVTPNGTIYIGHDSKISVYDPKQLYIWDKYTASYETRYYWNRYTIETETVTVYEEEGKNFMGWDVYYRGSGSIPYGSSYSFDPTTGKFSIPSVSGSKSVSSIESGDYPSVSGKYFPVSSYTSNGYSSYTLTLSNSATDAIGILYFSRAIIWPNKDPEMRSAKSTTTSTQVKGSYIGQVYSTSPNEYPADGIYRTYWYVYASSAQAATGPSGQAIDQVTSPDEYAYPNNGEKDGYWYIRR